MTHKHVTKKSISIKHITIFGYIVAALAIVLAIVSREQAMAFPMFLVGFLLVGFGTISGIIKALKTVDSRWMRLGMEIGAGGIIVVVLGALLGVVSSTNYESEIVNTGYGLLVIGIGVAVFGLAKKT